MSGLVLPTRGNPQPSTSNTALAQQAPGATGVKGGGADEGGDKGKAKAANQEGDDAGAVIPGVNGIVPTLQ